MSREAFEKLNKVIFIEREGDSYKLKKGFTSWEYTEKLIRHNAQWVGYQQGLPTKLITLLYNLSLDFFILSRCFLLALIFD